MVDEIAAYECSSGDSYIGTQKKSSLLGTKDGEWQKVRGISIPISVLILLIVLVVIIVIFIIIISFIQEKESYWKCERKKEFQS